jgi:NADH-ubiquinone oxidoreductase chain 5
MLIGSLALMGFPFLTGFYSKDIILEVAYAKFTFLSHFAYLLGTLAAFCTAFYSIRLLFLVFLAEPNGNRLITINSHEGSWRIVFPLFILSFFSISIGYLTHDFFIGFGTNYWNDSIFILISNYSLVDIEFVNLFYKLLPLFVTILGAFFAYFIYSFNLDKYFLIKKTKIFKKFYTFFNKKWYFDRIYNEIITQKFLNLSYFYTYKNIDRGLLETFGPSGIINFTQANTKSIASIQSGYISHYLFLFFISIIVLTYFIFSIFVLYSFNLLFFFFIYFIIH